MGFLIALTMIVFARVRMGKLDVRRPSRGQLLIEQAVASITHFTKTSIGPGGERFAPFVGVGYDNGFNGAANGSYTYGLVGATTGTKIGPGFALLGVKTRVGSSAAVETKQTVVFGTYSIPVAKNVAFNINAGKSYQDIKEDSYGVGLRFGF
jgi:hypothetical protein